MRRRPVHSPFPIPALFALLLVAALPLSAQDRGAAAFGEAVTSLSVSARVLVIAAHPDDEDTRLIAWLGRGRHAEVAYLSLTRGDGGQNLIGNELGEALGVIRTEELLSARRVDGADQYFTRAYDFGFSKSAEETFTHWPRDSILRDVVTVVRAYRPHVVVAVFSGTPRDGHGHHQASGILAREGYDVASDTVRFPLRAGERPWTPLKFYRTRSYWGGEGATFRYNAGEYSALLGRSYAEIAGESRSQHRSQAFGVLQRKGYVPGSVTREATRVNESVPAQQERSIFEGIDTTLARLAPVTGSAAHRTRIDSLIVAASALRRQANPMAPESSLPTLERMSAIIARLPAGAAVGDADYERSMRGFVERLDRALALAHGVAVEATVPRDLLAAGDTLTSTVTVYNRGGRPLVVERVAIDGDAAGGAPASPARSVAPDSAASVSLSLRGRDISAPAWLAVPRRGGVFGLPASGRAENGEPFTGATVVVSSGGTRFTIREPVVHRFADPVRGEAQRPLAVVPTVTLTVDRTVMLAPAGGALDRVLQLRVRSAIPGEQRVRLSLELPRGLSADSAARTVTLAGVGDSRAVDFRIRGALPPGRYTIAASAELGGRRFTSGYVPIEYEHIRPQKLYRQASLEVEAVDVRLPPRANVAYIQGVGDNVARSLEELGVPVTILDPTKLASTDFGPYTAVVVGTRAYEAHPHLASSNARLLDWVRAGGTMVVQYGQYEMLQPGIMPYPITLGRPATRVTVEEAPVSILRGDHPLLTTPNRIGDADWRGWVQERALYMPSAVDSAYRRLLSMSDPGEPANEGALLVAPVGKGMYVYTTLALFRQLPAGVPGAARLIANLIGARQEGAVSNGTLP